MTAIRPPPRHSAIYRGQVVHERFLPRPHRFALPLFMLYLDLDELPTLFEEGWWWRREGPALASFYRRDYLGDPRRPLAEEVRDLVAARTGLRPRGAVRMLTHPRYGGVSFNPVTFYYCFAGDGTTLQAIVAHITNTPWGERHAYVLACAGCAATAPQRFRFAKRFHVSPFMGMDQTYAWSFQAPGRQLGVHMANEEGGEILFHASLLLQREVATQAQLVRQLLRQPLMTVQVIATIYFQAFRLWWKRIPFHPHPGATDRAHGTEAVYAEDLPSAAAEATSAHEPIVRAEGCPFDPPPAAAGELPTAWHRSTQRTLV